MPLESIKRNNEVCKDIESKITSITKSRDVINAIAGQMATLKAEIAANTAGYFDESDVAYLEGNIDQFKTLVSSLNTTVQAL